MTEFKVGDRVKLVGDTWAELRGRFATIAEPYKYSDGEWLLRVDDFSYDDSEEEKDGHPASGFEIKFASRPFTAKVATLGEELGLDGSNLSEFGATVGKFSAEDPNHYKFPGGVEVRQISAYLTSFGGQALQYIARATRLDGQNKGDAESDLKKAIRFIEWELERLESL